ncbi:hypothetical protein LOD99_7030 [Oopsacas minuta]|uniref:Uncharacterized protein n=1 Tax=Oopsacas minuta TaxID=111878 RepID=A0AAV7JJJ4_9METZ|nr:hypothetical protein LOD99_7030 [Oopsacas minuta]
MISAGNISFSRSLSFHEQIKESRKKIRDCFKKSHEALQLRESILLSRIDQIEKDYDYKTEKMNKLVEALDKNKSMNSDTLLNNELDGVISLIRKKITEVTTETDSSIAFQWNNQFEKGIERLGSITTVKKGSRSDGIFQPTRISRESEPTLFYQQEKQCVPVTVTLRKDPLSIPNNFVFSTDTEKPHSQANITLFAAPQKPDRMSRPSDSDT